MAAITFAHSGNNIIGTLTPENISIGSSRTVNKKLVSLENRNKELRNIPHTTAIPITRRNTITAGNSLKNNASDFNTSIKTVKTTVIITLSNREATAFPRRTAALLLGDRKISSSVP
jgi:hypothetical protein